MAHGHPIVLLETFVDVSRHKGSCYRAAGFQELGQTKGFSRQHRKQSWDYIANGKPKWVLVKELCPGARSWLCEDFLVPQLIRGGRAVVDLNRIAIEGPGGLISALAKIPDPRHRRGVRHS